MVNPEYDSIWLQSKVVALALSILQSLLNASSASASASAVPEMMFLDDNEHRLYKLCAEVAAFCSKLCALVYDFPLHIYDYSLLH